MKLPALIPLLAFVVISTPAQAGGDAEAGKAKAQACFACHGVNGNSSTPMFPSLAGQHASYLAKQLADFKSGKRQNALMAGQVASLSPQDMADLAAFFAEQKPVPGNADETKVALGEKIYRGGNKESGVSACMACHSPTGAGNPPARFPRLSGQHAAYTAAQLKAFRKGQRANDPGKMMQNIAAHMSDKEIDAVASYIQGLH
jgi:cytochrome c553